MANKTNIRSIRFSDELAELIEGQQGQNFTEKFENLVTRCVWEVPAREKELAELERRIREKRAGDVRPGQRTGINYQRTVLQGARAGKCHRQGGKTMGGVTRPGGASGSDADGSKEKMCYNNRGPC